MTETIDHDPGGSGLPELRVDPGSPVPIYAQLARQIEDLVLDGILEQGQRLPSVRELAARARINRNTAARVIADLESRGVLETRVGRGTFVARTADRWSRRERRRRVEDAVDSLLRQAGAAGLSVSRLTEMIRERSGGPSSGEEAARVAAVRAEEGGGE